MAPIWGDSSARSTGLVSTWSFRAAVRSALRSGSSGLALISTGWNPADVLSQFGVRATELLRVSLHLEHDSELMHELGGVPPVGWELTQITRSG